MSRESDKPGTELARTVDHADTRAPNPPSMSNLSTVFNTLRWARPPGPGVGEPSAAEAPTELVQALGQMDLLVTGDRPRLTRLPSGPAAALYRADLAWGTACLKRALPVPGAHLDAAAALARSDYEIRWLRVAREMVPAAAPEVIAEHPASGVFVMEHLDPQRFPTWSRILEGDRVEPWIAAEIGHLLGRLHAGSASGGSVQQRFKSTAAFRALCIEPRMRDAASAHPDCADPLTVVLGGAARHPVALVHGAFSTDNVLVGPRGPVVINADCATCADPVFDFAHMLADLAMWMLWRPRKRADYAACFDTFQRTYLPHVTWEMTSVAEARTARMVAALLLACLEAPGPSRHLVAPTDLANAREAARSLLLEPRPKLDAVRDAWIDAIAPDAARQPGG
jgi:aminoglycoside phosphotransferase (APT) family kinase protein